MQDAWDETTVVGNASGDDLQKLCQWRTQLEQDIARINNLDGGVGGSRQMEREDIEIVTERAIEQGADIVQYNGGLFPASIWSR